MPELTLTAVELCRGQTRLRCPAAHLTVGWPPECTRFDLRDPRVEARCSATLLVPKDASPLHAGQCWQLQVRSQGKRFVVLLLATEFKASNPGPDRWHRLHAWEFTIVGFTSDPLGLFPHPSPEEELADFAALLRAELPGVRPARFNAEGGFTP